MTATLDRRSFRDQFKRRAVVIPRLPASAVRDLALRVNELDGYGDASLRTRAEHEPRGLSGAEFTGLPEPLPEA